MKKVGNKILNCKYVFKNHYIQPIISDWSWSKNDHTIIGRCSSILNSFNAQTDQFQLVLTVIYCDLYLKACLINYTAKPSQPSHIKVVVWAGEVRTESGDKYLFLRFMQAQYIATVRSVTMSWSQSPHSSTSP